MEIDIRSFTPDMTDAVGQLIIKIQRDEFELPLTLDDQPDLDDIPGSDPSQDGI